MAWWYGIFANSVVYTSLWGLSSKYLPDTRQYTVQLAALPLVYGLNVWYAKSAFWARQQAVPFVYLILFSAVGSSLVAFIWSLVLHQPITWRQVAGAVVAVCGMALLGS